MTVSPIEKAQARIATTQASLDDALTTGSPTTDLRETLALAQDELRRIQVAAKGQDAAQVAANHQQLDAEARRLVEIARMDLAFAVQDLGTVTPPEASLPLSVAQSLVQARGAQAEHRGLVRDHEGRLAALRARLTALAETRAQIIARRAEGQQEPGDGAQLALLDADREGLSALIARTEAQGPGPDESRVADFQRQWDQVIARERGRILADIARQLDTRLAEVLGQIRTNRTGPWYRPSAALEAALRSL